MALFNLRKKEEKKEAPRGKVVGFTKPKRFLFLKIKSKPIYEGQQPPQQQQRQPETAQPMQKPQTPGTPTPRFSMPKFSVPKMPGMKGGGVLRAGAPHQEPAAARPADQSQAQRAQQMRKEAARASQQPEGYKRPTRMQIFFASVAAKHKDLEVSLRTQGIKESPIEFVRKMFINTAIISVIITVAVAVLLLEYGITPILAVVLGVACFYGLFNRFIQYPIDRGTVVGKEIEKDILFAARDLVISMRSGMPLFNAMTAVSTGYGAASREFAKIVELVQLGTPIEQAMEDVSARSKSKTFKRIMLQATVSIKAGADVVGALQGVVEEVTQERIIELRRYGQRLNALAMFYMLFGVIFPSMGIAVAAILTTFISLFTVDNNTLLFALVGIFFLQLIFLNIMRSSRPTFAM